jgi:hypothetical protein
VQSVCVRETARFVETALPVEVKIEAERRVLLPERLQNKKLDTSAAAPLYEPHAEVFAPC